MARYWIARNKSEYVKDGYVSVSSKKLEPIRSSGGTVDWISNDYDQVDICLSRWQKVCALRLKRGEGPILVDLELKCVPVKVR